VVKLRAGMIAAEEQSDGEVRYVVVGNSCRGVLRRSQVS
jgi:hypothetical protein